MEKISIKSILLMTVFLLSIYSCEEIGENERFVVKNEVEVTDDSTGGGTEDFYARKVLIEEYTGQMCVNCPEGHAMTERITADFRNKVVVVGIHAGSLAVGVDEGGLMTADGDVYAAKYGVTGYPSVIINRTGTPVTAVNNWYGLVDDAVSKAGNAPAAIVLNSNISTTPEGVTAVIESVIHADKEYSGMSYQLMLIENNVLSWQQLPGDEVYDVKYIQQHVYRCSVNGAEGEVVALNKGENTLKHNVKIHDDWKAENLAVVGVLSDSKGVVQVESCRLNVPKNNE